MRCWFCAVAYPKKNAAQALTTSPMKVSTLGLILVSASHRTIVRSSTAQARPKALVQVIRIESLNHRGDRSLKNQREVSMIQSPDDSMIQFSSLCRGLVVNRSKAQYFQLAIAVRSHDHSAVADFFVQQGPANRRSGRNFAGRHIRLFAGHDVVHDFLILGAVVNLYCRTQPHFVL